MTACIRSTLDIHQDLPGQDRDFVYCAATIQMTSHLMNNNRKMQRIFSLFGQNVVFGKDGDGTAAFAAPRRGRVLLFKGLWGDTKMNILRSNEKMQTTTAKPVLLGTMLKAATMAVLLFCFGSELIAQTCNPSNLGTNRTQVAGSMDAFADVGDFFVYPNVVTTRSGEDADVVLAIENVTGVPDLAFSPGGVLVGALRPSTNDRAVFRITFVESGSATSGSPSGVQVATGDLTGVRFRYADLDSEPGIDATDVGGYVDGSPSVLFTNTAIVPAFPLSTAVGMDPARFGNVTNWVDEPNQGPLDNYVDFFYGDSFVTGRFFFGYHGTSTTRNRRGGSFSVCADLWPVAVDDSPAAVDGAVGATIPNVVTNDTLGGTANPTIGTDVTVNETGTAQDGATALGLDVTPVAGGITLNPADGVVTIDPGTTAGTYVYTYEICDVLNPANCDTAEVTVVVDETPPVATNDTVTPTAPGPVTINPLANDTGNDPLDPATVVLTGTGMPSGSTLAPDGKTLTVPGEGEWTVNPTSGVVTFTPEAGFSGSPTPATYVVSDVMGRTSNEAVLSVLVLAPLEIIANNDGPIALNGMTGATSSISLLGNDTLGGAAIADPSVVALTPVSLPSPVSGSISVNADGTVTVAPGTTPGTYTIEYQICEVANPTNCSTAQAEIIVLESDSLISEIDEDLTAILEEDLANTLTMQSRQISGYSADALDRLRGRDHISCLADVNARLAVESIFFDTDKAIIKSQSNRILDEIAAILISCPGSAFEIAGHTDSDASDAYNIDLSQRRVVAVRHALAQRGVDTTGYVARGYGESQPIASNATAAGKAQNRRVEFRSLDAEEGYDGPCHDSFNLVRGFNLQGNDNGVNADGQFLRDEHDCITDRREVFEGSLSYTDTAQGQTQSAINLSYRREQYRGSDSVFGYFVGLYGSQSDVSNRANGEIRGVGLNAGIYGANRLQESLFLDYYLGTAAGRHEFGLAFDRSVGTISATGDYQYLAGFAGAALSGEVDLGDTKVTPRIGFDYVYTPGADVDVIAELGGLSEVGTLDLEAISGGRVFAELRVDRSVLDGNSNLWITPRVACYQSLGSLDGVCGLGGSIGVESKDEDSDLSYAFELDGEWGEDYSLGSLTYSAKHQLDLGVISGDAGLNSEGSVTMGANYEIKF